MELTSGRPEIVVGLIDGPVMTQHANLTTTNIRELPGTQTGTCTIPSSLACMHGTFVAGILNAKRTSTAPGICPDCTLLIRPIFPEITTVMGQMPGTTPQNLAKAIYETVQAGAHIVNLSLALDLPFSQGQRELNEALDFAASRRSILVAAAGNQGTLGGSLLMQHPSVIPVAAYGLEGRPLGLSNLGQSIGRRGLGAPGENITSLGTINDAHTFSGTSTATPFVSGTIALLWSIFPAISVEQIKLAITQPSGQRRKSVVPPLLSAEAAFDYLSTHQSRS